MADQATLENWLTLAEAARHKLATGTATASVKYGDREVTYSKADLGSLDAYIADLRSQLSPLDGTPQTRRRPINLTF
jgi:hypothetical protein